MSIIQEITAHRIDGWQGQYNRMMRWVGRFRELSRSEYRSDTKTHDYFDTLYACFQNIFMLKDWLLQNTELTNNDLNQFVNNNIEIGVCRDICNGTKHYNISSPSVTEHFGIIREFNSLNSSNNTPKFRIIVISGGKKFMLLSLIEKSVELWGRFIENKLSLKKEINT